VIKKEPRALPGADYCHGNLQSASVPASLLSAPPAAGAAPTSELRSDIETCGPSLVSCTCFVGGVRLAVWGVVHVVCVYVCVGVGGVVLSVCVRVTCGPFYTKEDGDEARVWPSHDIAIPNIVFCRANPQLFPLSYPLTLKPAALLSVRVPVHERGR